MSFHGNPCWYELTTTQGKLDEAGAFYGRIFGWNVVDSGMEEFSYHLATIDRVPVAGLMNMPDDVSGMPPCWMIYFAVDDCDAFCRDATAKGASVHRPPSDIEGTGRFAILADPQGAAFGVLQPDMSQMSAEEIARAREGGGAFNQSRAGFGNWNELMSSDPEAAWDFYAPLLGWRKGDAMDMGEMGTYQLFRRDEADIGAMMGLADSPVPSWLAYFGVDGSVAAKVEEITAAGGAVLHGPIEVPGPAWVAVATDPQGAAFAVVGPEK
ncbi:hypothetical protein SAMN05421538_10368 [Paracoccus isoporae]|uniref:VOC domain-containing protein n=1 Tax=Paracoccus isoporae TaxID=591205 RepID=A0A1G6YVT1_9RHOB|nr:VOC family protein [Paracoccus isoporae]SDD93755.1 hypothetical protein SAMN05421538_10368 [Paracoccus isoporae]